MTYFENRQLMIFLLNWGVTCCVTVAYCLVKIGTRPAGRVCRLSVTTTEIPWTFVCQYNLVWLQSRDTIELKQRKVCPHFINERQGFNNPFVSIIKLNADFVSDFVGVLLFVHIEGYFNELELYSTLKCTDMEINY